MTTIRVNDSDRYSTHYVATGKAHHEPVLSFLCDTETEAHEILSTLPDTDRDRLEIVELRDMPTLDEAIEASDSGNIYRHSELRWNFKSHRDDFPYEIGDSISYSDLESTSDLEITGTDFYVPSIMSGSDYSNSCAVEASNHRVFVEQYGHLPGIHEVHGGHGSYGVAIRLDCMTYDMIETLNALADYPVMDEEDMSQLEMEWQNDSWSSWAESDFVREITKVYGQTTEYCSVCKSDVAPGTTCAHGITSDAIEPDQFTDTELDSIGDALTGSSDLREFFESLANALNIYWECDGHESAHIDIDRMVSKMDEPVTFYGLGHSGNTITPIDEYVRIGREAIANTAQAQADDTTAQ